jgi:Flp pilus assembly protein TadD
MPIPSLPRALRRLLLPTLLLTTAPAAFAQYPAGATVQSLPQANDPAELLATALRTLAVQPSNLAALTAAGHNALVLGDPNAAVGFFGRAQEIAPRDGHVKAGLGSALIELEKPQDALRLFAEASRLGVPDDEIAEDRGLAYDLTGDPKKAQHDYAIVLAAHPEDDVARRRLALSQGISGDKAAAIATLDPLIRKRDIAGWRAQTFVLAMNGDAKGASDITHIMLPQQADMLQPFLVRLSTLSPADKARAVNFGEMPAAGHAYTPTELANTGAAPTYAVAASTPRSAPTPRVATRPSDLAPPPVAASRAATPAPMTAVAAATRVPVGDGANGAYRAAPLAGIALSPAAPASQAATQIIPTSPPTATTPSPVRVAQAYPAPAASGGSSVAELPTSAAVGHYDLPHDVARPSARVAPPSGTAAATSRTVGTPVVHAPSRTALAATTPAPKTSEPGSARLAAEDARPTADRNGAMHRLADDGAADVPPSTRHAKRKSAPTTDDAADVPDTAAKTKRGARFAAADSEDGGKRRSGTRGAKSSSPDDGDDASVADKKGHRASRGKLLPEDSSDDQPAVEPRKGRHGKADAADDADTGGKTRKGAHGAKASASDDGDVGTTKSRKGAHGKTAADDDGASRSARKDDAKSAPERVFVQVAGGANKDDMDKAWAGLKKKAPDLMKGHTPQTAPVHATNRLLVGPFKSEDEAQAFVNKMAGKGLSGFTVKTSKGQKVEKVDTAQ